MILCVKSGAPSSLPDWQRVFRAADPALEVRWLGDPAVDPAAVGTVFVWEPPPGVLATLPNLRLIVSSGAGVDHIVADPAWPRHVPIVRMGGEETGQRMAEYVTLACLGLLRGLPRIIAGQRAGRWDHFDAPRTATETRVGIMGLGNLGLEAARMLGAVGFRVAGWSRTAKRVAGVECFGEGERKAFLAQSDLLVNLLPDTAATKGAIDAATLAKLPPGAGVVNAGRGPQLVMDALLAALDAGHLSGAVLDVFETEPLPGAHPAWVHPKVIVTPHLASLASRAARARYVVDAMATLARGGALPNLYDPARGY